MSHLPCTSQLTYHVFRLASNFSRYTFPADEPPRHSYLGLYSLIVIIVSVGQLPSNIRRRPHIPPRANFIMQYSPLTYNTSYFISVIWSKPVDCFF